MHSRRGPWYSHAFDRVSMLNRIPISKLLWAFATIVTVTITAAPAFGDSSIEPIAAQFKILSSDGKVLLGHSSYRVESHTNRIVLIGENRYSDGEYDIERDELKLVGTTGMPKLISFEHTFFKPNGSRKMAGRADLRTGHASCITYEDGVARTLSARFALSADIYAGASAVLALEHALTSGKVETTFQVFDCVPEPKVVSVVASWSDVLSEWSLYPGKLMKVEVTADLGWLGTFLDGFLPHRTAWFVSNDGWHYAGGKIQRYLALGAQVLLVRQAAPDLTAVADKRK